MKQEGDTEGHGGLTGRRQRGGCLWRCGEGEGERERRGTFCRGRQAGLGLEPLQLERGDQ